MGTTKICKPKLVTPAAADDSAVESVEKREAEPEADPQFLVHHVVPYVHHVAAPVLYTTECEDKVDKLCHKVPVVKASTKTVQSCQAIHTIDCQDVVELTEVIRHALKRHATKEEAMEFAKMLDQDGDGKLTVQELLDIIEKRQALYNDSLSEDEVESVESQLKDQEEKRELEEEVINEETAIDKVKDERGKP